MWYSLLLDRLSPSSDQAAREARERARRRQCKSELNRSVGMDTEIPPLDAIGLHSIEQRAERASPARLQHLIAEIDRQYPLMRLADREHARVLRLKLQRLL